MVDRVALAIYVANNHSADTWEREPAQYLFLRMARAAIGARCGDALSRLAALVAEQAEDDGCWFVAERVCEAYLQQELRRLHEAAEAVIRGSVSLAIPMP